jgi:UDP-GlcNAc:undecaprenyl-phosphate GlcNAc-1-phosphate transferase
MPNDMGKIDNLLICVLAGFGVAFGVIVVILRAMGRRHPVSRSPEFHHAQKPGQLPVPRFGGLALAASFTVLICLPLNFLFGCQTDSTRWVIAGTALAMFGLGFWDDLRALGAKYKLAGQLIIASAAYFLGMDIHQFKVPLAEHVIDLGFYAWPVTVFWLVAMTNLINLIDGVDGLAGGIAWMLMILLAAVGSGTEMVSLIAAGMAGALLAFLRFNFPPARIYLGDGGAYFLGFLIGALAIFNSHKGTVAAALIAPLFVLVLPIMDTSLAILRRGLQGLPLFRPDQRHLHHRLLRSGVSRRNLTLGAYMFTAYFLGLGLVAFWWGGQYLALLLGGATLAVLLVASQFGFSRQWFNVGAVLGRSIQVRTEVQYALAHSRWLAMEGERGRNVQGICEDTALIAGRLGFASLRIQLQDGEQVWKLNPCEAVAGCAKQPKVGDEDSWTFADSNGCRCHVFRHHLPGHPSCLIELQTPVLGEAAAQLQPALSPGLRNDCAHVYQIMSEVLAEGWAKSLAGWHEGNKLPVCFKPLPAPVPIGRNLVVPLSKPNPAK